MGTESRTPDDARLDPQVGDTLTYPSGSFYTVTERDYDTVVVSVKHPMTAPFPGQFALHEWSEGSDDPEFAGVWACGTTPAEGSDAPAADTSPLDRLGTDAQTLVTLLRAAALAAAPGTPKYARDAAEGWLRGVFAATYGTYPADATERDPRTDPRPGDTKTWTEGGEPREVRVVNAYPAEDGTVYDMDVLYAFGGPRHGDTDTWTLEAWGRVWDGAGSASWTRGPVGGAS